MDVGLKHLRQRIKHGGTIPDEVLAQPKRRGDKPRATGRDAVVQDITEGLQRTKALQKLAALNPQLDVLAQTEASMPRYISLVQTLCNHCWSMRRVLLDHLGRVFSGGFVMFLWRPRQIWPDGATTLESLSHLAESRHHSLVTALYVAMVQIMDGHKAIQLRNRLEKEMIEPRLPLLARPIRLHAILLHYMILRVLQCNQAKDNII